MLTRRARNLTLAAAALATSMAATGAFAADAARGARLAYACMGCHGVDMYKNAYPKYSVPKLGGQNEAYITAALEAYASGQRQHPTMRGYASTLSAEDRADIAAFIAHSGQPRDGAKAPAGPRPEKADLCAACHGQDGQGTLDEYPNIGGQHADYLARALDDYRKGRRQNPLMAPMAQQLTDEDVEALSAYFARQPGLVTLKAR